MQFSGQLGQFAQNIVQQNPTLLAIKRSQGQTLMLGPGLAPVRIGFKKAGPCGKNQQDLFVAALPDQILQQFPRTGIRPMEIIENQNQRILTSRRPEKFDRCVNPARMQLLDFILNPANIRAFGKIEAQQVAQKMDRFDLFGSQKGPGARLKFFEAQASRVALQNLKNIPK